MADQYRQPFPLSTCSSVFDHGAGTDKGQKHGKTPGKPTRTRPNRPVVHRWDTVGDRHKRGKSVIRYAKHESKPGSRRNDRYAADVIQPVVYRYITDQH